MQIRTVALSVSASRENVFRFLADIENLPKWATESCERLELRHDGWWAYTSRGEMMVEVCTDDRAGIIDFRLGPSVDELGLFPLRVLSLAKKRTLISFIFIQSPEQTDELCEKQFLSLLIEMQGLIRRFGGGELHVPEAMPRLAVSGLN